MFPRPFLSLALCTTALAQTVHVYSEFERIDPFGKIVTADKTETPREILSPALARNAWTSFQVAVELPGGSVFIGQNPENTVKVNVYRAVFAKAGNEWVPDALERLEVTPEGQVPAVAPQVPGQKVALYWMDLWVSGDTPPQRSRLEIQVNAGDRWVIYPMELRIQNVRVPVLSTPAGTLAPAKAASSESALAAMQRYVCGTTAGDTAGPVTIRSMIRRNAQQDMAVARSLEAGMGRASVIAALLEAAGANDAGVWCKAPSLLTELGPEGYFRVRSVLYRKAR